MIDSHRTEQSEQPASPAERASSVAARTTTLSVAVRRGLAGFTLDIAFDAPRGLTVLFGPSGAGKSLTLQAIAGLFPLDSASIALEGLVWHDSDHGFYLAPQRRHVGYVPQHYALFPHLTIEQNIAFGLKGRGKQSKQRVVELIELMQLGGLEERRPAQLSGGQQQRVALARALAPDPLLLLLDEPFSSLDAAVRETLREELRALHERVHVPIVLVTHDAAEARMLADTVVVIQQGHALQVGTPGEVFRSPRTRAIAALVGMHTCWRGKVDTVADNIATVWICGGQGASDAVGMPLEGIRVGHREQGQDGLTLQVCIPASKPVHIGQMLELGIRTDEIRVFPIDAGRQVAESFDGQTAPITLVRGTVLRDRPRGALHSITMLLETGQTLDIPMIAREMHDLGIDTGSPLMVGIPLQAVHVFED